MDHTHEFKPLKTGRSDLIVLYCECGETQVIPLPDVVGPLVTWTPGAPRFPRMPPVWCRVD